MIHYLLNRGRALFRQTIRQRSQSSNTDSEISKYCFTVATRLSTEKFWKKSATGNSLKQFTSHPNVEINIYAHNTRGLGEVYADAVQHTQADYLILLHDDICLLDDDLLVKLHRELSVADIVGVAGTRYRHSRQPAWLFSKVQTSGGFAWDHQNLSGKVAHGNLAKYEFTDYGPVGANCKLLDGAFLGLHTRRVKRANINFSTEFTFHFYDMDFCRSAEQCGLLMRTADINILHESSGAFGTTSWWDAYRKYLAKWEN